MLGIKLILRLMLSLPGVKEVQMHPWIAASALVYFSIVFFVLKTFDYNKDRFEE